MEHVKQDLDMLRKHIDQIRAVMAPQDAVSSSLRTIIDGTGKKEQATLDSVLNWYRSKSAVRSDHILNLFQEVDGVLPRDKGTITAPIKKFLAMDPKHQMIYRVGRRTGIFSQLTDLMHPDLLARAEAPRDRYGVTEETIDPFTQAIMKQYI